MISITWQQTAPVPSCQMRQMLSLSIPFTQFNSSVFGIKNAPSIIPMLCYQVAIFKIKIIIFHQKTIRNFAIMKKYTVEQKQTFLRKQILDSGVDAQNFIEYMQGIQKLSNNPRDSITLETWSMQELQSVVQQFKQETQKQKKQEANPRTSIKRSKIFEIESQKPKEKVYYGGGLWDYQMDYIEECNRSENIYKFDKEDPKAKIEKYQIKSVGGYIFGIGSKNQLTVLLSTNFAKMAVIRKNQDFDWLKNILIVTHPGCFVPALEQSRQIDPEDKKRADARVQELERFINNCLKFQEFHSSKYLKEFLEQTDSKKFTHTKNVSSGVTKQKNLDNISTLQGMFHVDISSKINTTLKHTSAIASEMNPLYTDITVALQKIQADLENISKHIFQVANLCGKMFEKSNEFNTNLQIKDFKMPTMFMSFNNILSTLGKNVKRNAREIQRFDDNFIKNVLTDWKQFAILEKKRLRQAESYYDFKSELLRRKQKYWQVDFSKWELPQQEENLLRKEKKKMSKEESFLKMFPNDNQKEKNMKIWLSFFNRQYLKSLEKMLQIHERQLQQKFLAYSGEYLCLSKETSSIFENFTDMMIKQ